MLRTQFSHQRTQTFFLQSDAVDEQGMIDPRYTCDSDNSSPELRWRNPPEGTAGYALVAEDQDAPSGLFTHWVIYNIPNDLLHLPAGIPPQESLPNGIKQGINGFNKLGYAGPCPPMRDQAHRYTIRLYALRALPDLPARVSRDQLLQAIESVTIATTEIRGRYQRVTQAQRAG